MEYKKKIVFGTGSYFQKFADVIKDVSYFIDNDINKWGSLFLNKSIMSPDILMKENTDNIFIIIASSFYLEISNQLEEMGYKKNKHFVHIDEYLTDYNINYNGELSIIKKCIRKNNVVFDIGANIGDWSKQLLENVDSVNLHTFEPIHNLHQECIANLIEFKEKDKLYFNNLAVGNEVSNKIINYYDKIPTLSTIYRRNKEDRLNIHPTEKMVTVTTIDRYCEENDIKHVNFIKIDVEGSKIDVLKGATTLLKNGAVDYVQFEYGGTFKDSNTTLKEAFDIFKENNYFVIRITDNLREEVVEWQYNLEDYKYNNYLAVNNRLRSFYFNEYNKELFDLKKVILENDIEPFGIIHVGAHEGKEVGDYLQIGFENILFIEANPDVYKKLVNNLPNEDYIKAINYAVADKIGETEFYITTMDQSSSILKPKLHLEVYPDITVKNKINVKTITLDSLFENEKNSNYNILNIDIQGAELLALRGASKLLNTIDLINIEVNFEELYEGCPMVWEIDDYLSHFGFVRVDTSCPYDPSWGDAIYVKKPVLAMSTLGENGRFGNQLFQYLFLFIMSKENDCIIQTPKWIGAELFNIPYMPLVKKLSLYKEEQFSFNNWLLKDEDKNKDFWGYFQLHTSNYIKYRNQIKTLFTPSPVIKSKVEKAWEELSNGKTVIALHLRRGDYGFGFFYEAPTDWYKEWLKGLWESLDNPVLYIASDEPDKILMDFDSYNPVTAEDFNIELEKAPFYLDFYILSKSHFLAISNSTFSFMASMLNENCSSFVRPHLKYKKLIPYNPWSSNVLLTEDIVEPNSKIRLEQFLNSLKNESILIYGAGEHTDLLLNKTSITKKNIIGIVDKNKKKKLNYPIFSLEDIKNLNVDIIIISSFVYQDEIYGQVLNTGFKGFVYKIYNVDDRYVPEYW
ncbi:hypothetical protein UACE39S_04177 [Ureibacillus acetophenoni]